VLQVVWVGGLGPEGAVTERMLEDKMRPFGRIESIDIKRRPRHNDAFAFVVFEVLFSFTWALSFSISLSPAANSHTLCRALRVRTLCSLTSSFLHSCIALHCIAPCIPGHP